MFCSAFLFLLAGCGEGNSIGRVDAGSRPRDGGRPDAGPPDASLADDSGVVAPDGGAPDSGAPDAGPRDSGVGALDSGVPDAGLVDGGTRDAGLPDSGAPDAGLVDSGAPDSGAPDAGRPDAGLVDSGAPDSGAPDAGRPDAGLVDSGAPDSGAPDAGPPDAGPPDSGAPDSGSGSLTNLALGRPVIASGQLPSNPSSWLVDGQTGTFWNSGAVAPEWAKVDLQQQGTVSKVRLLVGQYPAGPTVHHVRLLSELGNVLAERTLDGSTYAGQWLELAFSPAVDGVRFVQVYTQASPSWVAWHELEALGTPTPTAKRLVDVPRGLRWVRRNPMFVSGLTVAISPPGADIIHEYYDAFGATANHYWETGLPFEQAAWASAGRADYRWLSWLLPNGYSRGLDAFAGGARPALPGRIGYQVSDEPPNLNALVEINGGIEALRPFDPGALLVVNFPYDNDEIGAMFDYFCASMDADVVSTDRYTYDLSKAHVVLDRFRELGLRCGRPYWRYLKAYHEDDSDSIDESDLRWDAFSGLAYGFTGHTWFIYQATPISGVTQAFYEQPDDFRSPKIVYWSHAAQINRELRNLGRAVTQLVSTDVRYLAYLDLWAPSGTHKWTRGAGSDAYLSGISGKSSQMDLLLGFFRDDAGSTYLMVQNQRHQHAGFPNQSKASGTFTLNFDFSAAPASLDRSALLVLNKVSGQVERLPLSGAGDARAITLTLAAGDPVLFKYADAHPFALQP